MKTAAKKLRFPLTIGGLIFAVTLHAGVALTAAQTSYWYGLSTDISEALCAIFIFFLLLLYLSAIRQLRKGEDISKRQLILFISLSIAPYLLNFLTNSSDVYNYIGYAELSQHTSPYLAGLERLGPGNPIYHGIWGEWRPYPSPYGPVWMGLVVIIGKLHVSLVAQLFLFKFIGIASFAGIVGILLRWRPGVLSTMVLLNPLFIIELIGDAHNDGLFALCILLAVLPYKKEIFRGFSFGLSVATKHISLALAPLFVAQYFYRKEFKNSLIAGGIAVLTIISTYMMLWVGPKTFDGLLVLGKHFYANPVFFPQKIIFSILRSVQPTLSMNSALQMAMVIGMSIAIVFVGYLAWQVFRGRLALPTAAFYTLSALIFFALQWVQPWYLTWPLALVPFLQPKHAFQATVVITSVWYCMLYTFF